MNQKREVKNSWSSANKVLYIFLFFVGILYIQYAYLALSPKIYGKDLQKFATTRNTFKTTLKAQRGFIYDKDKNPLAINASSYTVIAYLSPSRTGSSPTPKHVIDKEDTATKLAPIINMEKEQILKLLNYEVYQVELGPGGRNITEIKKELIENLNLPGISFIENVKRYYPNGDFASYIIGYAKQYEVETEINGITKMDYNLVGELSIEGKYNDILSGKDGYLEYQRDLFGYKIPDTKEIRTEPINGNDIYLTIDSNIQRFLESAVKEASLAHEPEWMTLTVMNAKTGAILGSASTPSFDPNKMNITSYENPLTSYVYEPGSVMKTYTYMCAMENKVYDGNKTYMSGSYKIGDDTIRDWNRAGWGMVTFDKGYEYSSNVGIANLMMDYLTKEQLKECLEKYGFGSKTGITLPRELTGTLNFNYDVEKIAAGFGQGITTTSIQQLQALTLIANDGYLVTPRIVDKIVDKNGKVIMSTKTIKSKEQVVSSSTVNKMQELMYNVIHGQDLGATTGRSYYIKDFDIIGKTATAQIFDNELGKYSDYMIYSYGGIFPKEDPQIIIYGSIKHPKTGVATGLATASKEVSKNIAKYLNIFGDNQSEDVLKEYEIKNYINKNIVDVTKELDGLDIVVLGNGNKVIKQSISVGTMLLTNDKIILLTNDPEIKMPSLIGWTREEAESLFKLINHKYTIEGYGYITSQSIPKNTIINLEDTVNIICTKKHDLG